MQLLSRGRGRIFDGMISFREATDDDVSLIRTLAEGTWWPAYASILSKGQIRYMLDGIYSEAALRSAMRDGQEFILLSKDDQPAGFASFATRPEDRSIVKLHKFYVLPDKQGNGLGRHLMQKVCGVIRARGYLILELNVNRYNTARFFYEKLGFKIIREEDLPIGPYWMNDYVMRLVVG